MSGEDALVDTAWLAGRLGRPGLRVVDASWHLPASGRDAREEYLSAHIPGAVFFDLERNSNRQSGLPHMMPRAEEFADSMSALGLSSGDTIVVYDASGTNISAARVWWMFRVMGHERAAVLDGGFGKWRRERREVEAGEVRLPHGSFRASLDADRIRSLDQMRANLAAHRDQVLDARSAGRFDGTAPEPRPGLRPGHVPQSRSLPFTDLVDGEGVLLPPAELAARFRRAGIDLTQPVVATCGSGVSAGALLHALHLIGHDRTALYDGSWAEWGARDDLPVER